MHRDWVYGTRTPQVTCPLLEPINRLEAEGRSRKRPCACGQPERLLAVEGLERSARLTGSALKAAGGRAAGGAGGHDSRGMVGVTADGSGARGGVHSGDHGKVTCTLELQLQLSKAPCVQYTSFGCLAADTMYVSNRCRGNFTCNGNPVHCSDYQVHRSNWKQDIVLYFTGNKI